MQAQCCGDVVCILQLPTPRCRVVARTSWPCILQGIIAFASRSACLPQAQCSGVAACMLQLRPLCHPHDAHAAWSCILQGIIAFISRLACLHPCISSMLTSSHLQCLLSSRADQKVRECICPHCFCCLLLPPHLLPFVIVVQLAQLRAAWLRLCSTCIGRRGRQLPATRSRLPASGTRGSIPSSSGRYSTPWSAANQARVWMAVCGSLVGCLPADAAVVRAWYCITCRAVSADIANASGGVG